MVATDSEFEHADIDVIAIDRLSRPETHVLHITTANGEMISFCLQLASHIEVRFYHSMNKGFIYQPGPPDP